MRRALRGLRVAEAREAPELAHYPLRLRHSVELRSWLSNRAPYHGGSSEALLDRSEPPRGEDSFTKVSYSDSASTAISRRYMPAPVVLTSKAFDRDALLQLVLRFQG